MRKCERSITRKLERFALIVSAGTLCEHRDPALTAIPTSTASPEQELLARLHILHCAPCRAEVGARVRELQRRLAELLPLPAGVESSRDRGVLWGAYDWLTKPFAPDASLVSSSGLGRGAGTALGLKVAMLCAGATTVVGGGICLHTTLRERTPDRPGHASRKHATPHDARPASTVLPTPSVRPPDQARARPTARARREDPSTHETSVVSPAPAGASEFGPTVPTSASQPATAPSSGVPEFP